MTDPTTPETGGEEDLFDLPIESISAGEVAESKADHPAARVEVPLAALPRRPAPAASSASTLTSVGSNADAILEQARKRTKPADNSTRESPTPVAPEPKPVHVPRPVWIALGVLAIVNVAVLTFLLLRPSTSADTTPTTVAATQSSDEASNAAEQPRAQAARVNPPSLVPDTGALQSARQVLRDARADIESGRRSAARTRLGRLGLVVDGIDPAHRDEIRAEAALLVAESLQADADEARRAKR